jgi:predicted nucleotidyltransferase
MSGTTVATKQDILDALHQHRSRLRAFGVARIGLFGSFVRGEQHPESDIDLLVEFEPARKTFDSFMELSFFLEELLSRRVELVTVESLSPYLGPHILKEVEYAALAV